LLKKLLLTCSIALCLLPGSIKAQELNARVQILTDKIQATNKQVFTTLETSIREFLNNRKWTNEKYLPQERIDCQFIINVTDWNGNRFGADIQVLYSRPVYKSDYMSPVLVLRDEDFDFNYLEYDRLDFNLNTSMSNLTSVLGYYVYIILGFDHDTFELRGGDPYYANAQQVLSNAQNNGFPGWASGTNQQNRYYFLDNLTSPAFSGFRNCLYQYHRLGMDLMHDPKNHKTAKGVIKNSLMLLEEVNNKRRNTYLMQVFFDAKQKEIVNVYSGGNPVPIEDLKKLLQELDAVNSSKYNDMGKG